MERTARNARIGGWARVALLVAAACYSIWLLEYALPVRVDPVHGYVSELPAGDQPYRWVFATGDAAAGALVLVVGIAGALAARGSTPLVRAAWWALALFGLATVLDVVFPLDCAPSVSQACHDAEIAWKVSAAHHIHAGTSVVAYLAVIAHMALTALSERRDPGVWPVLGRWAAALAGVMLVSALVVLALVPVAQYVGIPQRVSVVCVAVWLVLLGLGLGSGAEPVRRAGGSGAS